MQFNITIQLVTLLPFWLFTADTRICWKTWTSSPQNRHIRVPGTGYPGSAWDTPLAQLSFFPPFKTSLVLPAMYWHCQATKDVPEIMRLDGGKGRWEAILKSPEKEKSKSSWKSERNKGGQRQGRSNCWWTYFSLKKWILDKSFKKGPYGSSLRLFGEERVGEHAEPQQGNEAKARSRRAIFLF